MAQITGAQATATQAPKVAVAAKIGDAQITLAGAWGEILTVAAQARGIAGLVIDGAVRDTSAIAPRGFPIFSRGVSRPN